MRAIKLRYYYDFRMLSVEETICNNWTENMKHGCCPSIEGAIALTLVFNVVRTLRKNDKVKQEVWVVF